MSGKISKVWFFFIDSSYISANVAVQLWMEMDFLLPYHEAVKLQ